MPQEISKITLPSGNTYDIKDAVARQAIAGGMSKIIAWDGSSTPVVADIPAGITVVYEGTSYTGTLSAGDADVTGFYFVYSNTQEDSHDVYDEYTVVGSGSNKYWEKIGDTQLDLSDLGNLAYRDNVTASPSAVTFSGGTTDKVLGSDATFTTTVTPTTTNIKATASGATVGADGTDTFVKSYPGATSKLATTTVPNVTSAGSASTWSFAMGTGADAETLIISGANSTAPTLGTAKTVATGSLAANGGGDTVMTGLGTATTASALTGVKMTAQPTVALSTGATAGTGVISVATGITSATTATNNKDEVTAVTSIGTGTAAAQELTIS